MGVKGNVVGLLQAAWADEIERAIDNVSRTKFDKWMRKEWHKAAAREINGQKAGRRGGWSGRGGVHVGQPQTVRIGPTVLSTPIPRVWVKGHVPREFLDWVERHWSHDNDTRAMLGECWFEVWEG